MYTGRGESRNKCAGGGQGETEGGATKTAHTPTNQAARFTHQRVTPRVSNEDESHEAGKFATPIRSLPPGMDGALYWQKIKTHGFD